MTIKIGLSETNDSKLLYLTSTPNGEVSVSLSRSQYLHYAELEQAFWEMQANLRNLYNNAIPKDRERLPRSVP